MELFSTYILIINMVAFVYQGLIKVRLFIIAEYLKRLCLFLQ